MCVARGAFVGGTHHGHCSVGELGGAHELKGARCVLLPCRSWGGTPMIFCITASCAKGPNTLHSLAPVDGDFFPPTECEHTRHVARHLIQFLQLWGHSRRG